MIDSMAEADRIVEQYVKANGVIAEIDGKKVRATRFTTKKMREWYFQ